MNYRHIYHAGNFADVLKHAVLARLIAYLKLKDKPFRVIDTHAGIGVYDLSSEEAQKTGEWLGGIGKLLGKDLPKAVAPLLAPYLDVVKSLNATSNVRLYPGSPKLARMLLRKEDRLSLMELHPADYETLQGNFADDFQTRVTHLDGWLALNAHVPPKVYCLWYPLKRGAPIKDFTKALYELEIPKMLSAELAVRSEREDGLTGSGLVIVNPPYSLKGELDILLPFLKEKLAQDRFASSRIAWIRGE
jgi:23S rRNA (adenine2030-N6)-methyltransferase